MVYRTAHFNDLGQLLTKFSRSRNSLMMYISQTAKDTCKGVRCPPIFSLSNLINAGWLVRKCVNIHNLLWLLALIGRPICCMLALRWRTVAAGDRLLVLLKSNNWCLNVTYLWIGNNGFSWSRDIVWSLLTVWIYVIKSPFLWYRLQRSRYMKSDS